MEELLEYRMEALSEYDDPDEPLDLAIEVLHQVILHISETDSYAQATIEQLDGARKTLIALKDKEYVDVRD